MAYLVILVELEQTGQQGDSYTTAGSWTGSDIKLKTRINSYEGALNGGMIQLKLIISII